MLIIIHSTIFVDVVVVVAAFDCGYFPFPTFWFDVIRALFEQIYLQIYCFQFSCRFRHKKSLTQQTVYIEWTLNDQVKDLH